MFSLRSASLVASLAFGLMGCAAQGVGQPQTGASVIASYDPSNSYDPSSLYQPSPNYRPVAVTPSVARTANCAVAAEGSVGVSPNARLCP